MTDEITCSTENGQVKLEIDGVTLLFDPEDARNTGKLMALMADMAEILDVRKKPKRKRK